MAQPIKKKPPFLKKKRVPLDTAPILKREAQQESSSKVKEVSVSYGRTYNLGDFNSMKLQVGVTLDVAEGDDYLKIMAREIEVLKSFSRGQCNQIIGEES